MKKHLIRFSMIAALAASGVYAQDLRVDIPFDFMAGTGTFPAGEYLVRMPTTAPVMTIETGDHKPCFLGFVTRLRAAHIQEKGKLSFHRYGTRYILAEVWVQGRNEGMKLQRTKLERELIAEAAGAKYVTVAAR
jgi:hypothetical protein